MKGKSRKKQKRKVEKVDSKSLQSQVWREGEEEAQFFQHRRMSCDAGNDGIVKEKGTKVDCSSFSFLFYIVLSFSLSTLGRLFSPFPLCLFSQDAISIPKNQPLQLLTKLSSCQFSIQFSTSTLLASHNNTRWLMFQLYTCRQLIDCLSTWSRSSYKAFKNIRRIQ